jgi:hypothetical protein
MLFVFGCHDNKNGYFYRMQIWISCGNRWCYLRSISWREATGNQQEHKICKNHQLFLGAPRREALAGWLHVQTGVNEY